MGKCVTRWAAVALVLGLTLAGCAPNAADQRRSVPAGGNALPAPAADEATAAAPDVADLPLGGGGGGVTEVDPTSTLAETVETADAVALGRVASVDAGPSYGDDPGLGNIGYAHVIIEIGEAMKGETRPIVIDMPMFGRDLTDVAAALHGLRMLVFLRSLRVDAENAGQPALTGVEAGHFRILNMHGMVVDQDGRAVSPWSSEEFDGAPSDFSELVDETRRLAGSQ